MNFFSNPNNCVNMTSIKSLAIQNRIEWVDAAKGICIFFVIMCHFGADGNIFYPYYRYFFLTLFFFLSGYVTKTKDVVPFIKTQLKSLLIPYLCLSIILIILSPTFISSILHNTFSQYLNEQLLLLINGDKLWFISCLFIVQIEYFVLNKYVFQKCRAVVQITFAILLIFSCFLITRETPSRLPWNVDTSVCMLGYFSMGGY